MTKMSQTSDPIPLHVEAEGLLETWSWTNHAEHTLLRSSLTNMISRLTKLSNYLVQRMLHAPISDDIWILALKHYEKTEDIIRDYARARDLHDHPPRQRLLI